MEVEKFAAKLRTQKNREKDTQVVEPTSSHRLDPSVPSFSSQIHILLFLSISLLLLLPVTPLQSFSQLNIHLITFIILSNYQLINLA